MHKDCKAVGPSPISREAHLNRFKGLSVTTDNAQMRATNKSPSVVKESIELINHNTGNPSILYGSPRPL